MRFGTALVALGAITTRSNALKVASGSPCSTDCGNVLASTSADEISCSKTDYTTSSAGVVFRNCVNCELTSTFVNSRETDTQWMLYNLRYATSYCLFNFPEHEDYGDNPCMTRTACGPLIDAVQYGNLSTNGTSYDYCSKWISAQVPKCIGCVKNGDDFFGIKNFVTILDAACSQMPLPGTLVSVAGDPFSDTQVNITEPTPTGNPKDYTSSSFTLGAKVGIAIGGVLFILGIIGFCIVWNGKRRRRAFLRRLEAQHGQGGWPPLPGDMFETPVSQKPLTGWQDSPLSAHSEKVFPRYFSPYSSQYNSPTSAVEGPGNFQWPDQTQTREIGIALGGKDDKSANPDVKGKGKDMEEMYEMNEVDSQGNEYMPKVPDAPVLHHPGYGRGNPNRLYPDMDGGNAAGRGALI